MRIILYTLFLMTIISSDLIHTGYMLFCQDHHVEFSIDFSTEKESNEKTEVDEKEYEIPKLSIRLHELIEKSKVISAKTSMLSSKYASSIPSPPPDKQ